MKLLETSGRDLWIEDFHLVEQFGLLLLPLRDSLRENHHCLIQHGVIGRFGRGVCVPGIIVYFGFMMPPLLVFTFVRSLLSLQLQVAKKWDTYSQVDQPRRFVSNFFSRPTEPPHPAQDGLRNNMLRMHGAPQHPQCSPGPVCRPLSSLCNLFGRRNFSGCSFSNQHQLPPFLQRPRPGHLIHPRVLLHLYTNGLLLVRRQLSRT